MAQRPAAWKVDSKAEQTAAHLAFRSVGLKAEKMVAATVDMTAVSMAAQRVGYWASRWAGSWAGSWADLTETYLAGPTADKRDERLAQPWAA